MSKAEIVSRAKLREWNGGASSEQTIYTGASNKKLADSVSGNLVMTSNGTSQLAYEAHKRK
ncbi:MAG: hypothetical protein KJ697_01185 [Nanoarchaeota archaeon]|nr:hypothetical protein [Nanoarchaeota archaeon]MBU4123860.1 hypothetical protein [Nanoarchaeota archaeon]